MFIITRKGSGGIELILCEDCGKQYRIKFEGDTEELLAEACSILAAMCAEMKAEPIDMLYDIAMNFIPGYPNPKKQMVLLAEWLRKSADELAESEGVTS